MTLWGAIAGQLVALAIGAAKLGRLAAEVEHTRKRLEYVETLVARIVGGGLVVTYKREEVSRG